MKNKSLFVQIIFLILLTVCLLFLTIAVAFLAGTFNVELIDFKSLNISNMIPVFIVGGFLSCVTIGICCLFIGRKAFMKAKDYFEENDQKKKEI